MSLELRRDAFVLRSLRRGDRRAYAQLRKRNRSWLGPWDATDPGQRHVVPTFAETLAYYRRQERRGEGLALAIELDEQLIGQITAHGIQWGALRSAAIGYWVDEAAAGMGVAPLAVAMLSDHLLAERGLHRVEINIRPENAASLRVVEKLGFRDEGIRERYMHIDGRWCDHRTFALVSEDVPEGITALWLHTLEAEGLLPPGAAEPIE